MTILEVSPRPTIERLKELKDPRPNIVVILTTREQTPESFLAKLRAENPDVAIVHAPTHERDLVTPEDRENARLAVRITVEALKAGKHVIVSCMHSANRSPTLAAVVWAYHKKTDFAKAKAVVKRARPSAFDMQERTAHLFATALKELYGYDVGIIEGKRPTWTDAAPKPIVPLPGGPLKEMADKLAKETSKPSKKFNSLTGAVQARTKDGHIER